MSLQVKNSCDSFLNGFHELSSHATSSHEKGIAFLKVASYFLTAGLLALAFLVVREINKSLLAKNIRPIESKKDDLPAGPKNTTTKTNDVGAGKLGGRKHKEKISKRDPYSQMCGSNLNLDNIEGPLVSVPDRKKGQFPQRFDLRICTDNAEHWRQLTKQEALGLGLPDYVDTYPIHLRQSGIPYHNIDSLQAYVDMFWSQSGGERVYSLKNGYFDIDDIDFQNFALSMFQSNTLITYDEIAQILANPKNYTKSTLLDHNNPQHTLAIAILIRARNNAISSRPDIHPEGRFYTSEEINNGQMRLDYDRKKLDWNSLTIYSWFNWETGNLRKEINDLFLPKPSDKLFNTFVRFTQQTTQQAVESIALAYPDETNRICWLNMANAHMDGGILKGPSRLGDTNHGSQEENTISDCSAAVIQGSISDIIHGQGNDDGRARYKQGFHIPPGGNFFMKTSFVTGRRVQCNSIACAFADFRSDDNHIGFSEFNHFSENGILRLDDKYKRRIFMDIYGVLATAQMHEQKHLVLGGSGCGAFKHDHVEEAMMWKRVLALPEFAGCFKTVTFAITGKRLVDTFKGVFHN